MSPASNTHGPSHVRAILGIAIALLVALLVALIVIFFNLIKPVVNEGAVTAPGEMQWVRSFYGFGPSKDQQLKMPSSVAVAPNGDIYATDPSRARVMVFRSDGTFKRMLQTGAGGSGTGMFIRPEAIDVDAEGEVYIADSWANKIIVFDDQGRYLREWPVRKQARGVTVSGDRVYVLDLGAVLVFDVDGTLLSEFGARGPQPGQIEAYQGIAAKDGAIFIAEPFNKRLQAFDESGTILWTVPNGVAGRGGPSSREATGSDSSASDAVPDHRWDLPQDLVFDARGRLLVVDAFQFAIAVVDPKTGKVMATYGEFGRDDGQFYYPTSIDYDPVRDWVVVADTNNDRVQIVRIPDTSNPNAAALWRAASSPYRHLAIPVMLLVLSLLFGSWLAQRVVRGNAPPEDSDVTGA